MLRHDYSQLPVMSRGRNVRGLISWKSIGQKSVRSSRGTTVAVFMDHAVRKLDSSTPLIDAIGDVIRHEVVLVRDHRKLIVGIVTAADLSEQLLAMSQGFFLIGEIESGLRRLVQQRFSVEELRRVRSPDSTRQINSVKDLAMGEFGQLLARPDNWARLEVDLDRAEFIQCLERVRATRNAIMHFRVESDDSIDGSALREMQRLLRHAG